MTLTLPPELEAALSAEARARNTTPELLAVDRLQELYLPAAPPTPAAPKARKTRRSFADEPIAGMWKDRPEMEDSVEYVRQLRKREFRDPHA